MWFLMDHLLNTRKEIKKGPIMAGRRATQRIIISKPRKPNSRKTVGSVRSMDIRRRIVSSLRNGLTKRKVPF